MMSISGSIKFGLSIFMVFGVIFLLLKLAAFVTGAVWTGAIVSSFTGSGFTTTTVFGAFTSVSAFGSGFFSSATTCFGASTLGVSATITDAFPSVSAFGSSTVEGSSFFGADDRLQNLHDHLEFEAHESHQKIQEHSFLS